MNALHSLWHGVSYSTWLAGQIVKESIVMMVDTLGNSGKNIAPIVLYYPMRVTSEREIAAFIASITMTPGTLALGVTGPKEVDYDAAAGKRDRNNAFAVADSEFLTHGLDTVQRFLAVHAMYGENPQELLDSLADMEEHLVPAVKDKPLHFNIEHLVERGRPGPRGFRGTRGGRASDETVFDAERLDSTPHAAAFVAAILEMEDSEPDVSEMKDMDRKARYEVAQRHAQRAQERRAAEGTADADGGQGAEGTGSAVDTSKRSNPDEPAVSPKYAVSPNTRRRRRADRRRSTSSSGVESANDSQKSSESWYERKMKEKQQRKDRAWKDKK